jgi:RHS repeat-associated protein
MICDLNRGISNIVYNCLNLPMRIDISSPVADVSAVYHYSSDGKKLRVQETSLQESKLLPVSQSDKLSLLLPTVTKDITIARKDLICTDYCNNAIYEGDGRSYVLKRIVTDNGYIECGKYYFYLKDHLGNTRVVVNEVGAVVQSNDYYPFGSPFEKSEKCDQPFLYSGKEFETRGGLNSYDFGARTYDPSTCRFGQVDPFAEKYYDISPYVYCGDNPIIRIDPTGMDVWEINEMGAVINRKKDESKDIIYLVVTEEDGNYRRAFTKDADGNKIYKSISFKYGTIESQRTMALNSTDAYDIYKVRGDANGTQMFEFLSQNTTVEWSQAKTCIEGDKGLNFLTTSHNDDKERGMSNLYRGQLYAGYTIRELNHNHPSNTAYPSGSFVHPVKGTAIGEWGDVGFARDITNNRKANRLNIPTFNIYLPVSKSYINYGPNSVW